MKLGIANFIQAGFIVLLVVFIVVTNRNVKSVTEHKLEANKEMSEIKNSSLAIKDYFNLKISHDELIREHKLSIEGVHGLDDFN